MTLEGSQTVLPSNLLIVWKRKGLIQPRFAKPTVENLKVASKLIDLFRDGAGKKKRALKQVADELEVEGFDYRFVRALFLLLDRRSVFGCHSPTDPQELRRKIFHVTGENGPAAIVEQRNSIMKNMASQLEISSEKLEEVMYADLDSELILQDFSPISPVELLERYNLSLSQTLLFESTELRFTVSANWQKIFFMIKKLGLIYDVYKEGGFWVKIDGPSSLFKLTRRYGTAIAKLLPAIVSNLEWTFEAKILWRYTNEICTFKLESWRHRPLFGTQEIGASYDSIVEEDFAKRFEALSSGWQLKREPEPVVAGRHVLIPDFSFEREGVKIYMEVVGFWTPSYLLRKIEKLEKTTDRIMVVVDENLACEKLTKLESKQGINIIYYRNKIPLQPILRYLQDVVGKVHANQAELLKNLNVSFTEPVIKFEEFAARIGLSNEVVRTYLTEKPPDNYTALPEGLIRKDRLQVVKQKLDQKLEQNGRLALAEAAEIAQTEGIEITSALQTLGYKVIWHGLNAENAEVSNKE
jgi:predicted nuclease of restriction endonuclease-like RecB superfamily